MPVYFIRSEQITGLNIQLDTDLDHHLGNVLRLKVGEKVRLVDETPRQYLACVRTTRPGPVTLQVESETLQPVRDSPRIRLCVSMIKREKMDWMIQKATELGVSRISPIISERTVVRPDLNRVKRQGVRWGKIAKEAAQQSCRWDLPQIDNPVTIKHLFEEKHKTGFQFIFSEQCPVTEGKKVIQQNIKTSAKNGTLLIGPEGGWASSELVDAEKSGFVPVSLGERILRTETAVLSALSILQYELSDGNT